MAPGNFLTSTLTDSELISEMRDYKLKLINDEIKFDLSLKSVEKFKKELSFLTDSLPNDIISGSMALNLLGLLSRKTKDIDILIEDKERFTGYNNGYYDDEFQTPNRLGFKEFKWKRNFLTKEVTFDVDFFEKGESTFIFFQFENFQLKIHNPVEIMQYKLDMVLSPKSDRYVKRKHNEDLTRIFGKAPWQLALSGEIKF
jgi:hypothetical protein